MREMPRREKGLGVDPCVLKKDCKFRKVLTSEQKNHLVTPPIRPAKRTPRWPDPLPP